jgi:hypothetical protein
LEQTYLFEKTTNSILDKEKFESKKKKKKITKKKKKLKKN